MKHTNYEFRFGDQVPMADVEETLLMSVIATEGIHGRARVRLDCRYELDPEKRVCAINADNQVGEDVARVFAEFLLLELGDDGFEVVQRTVPCNGCKPAPEPRTLS